MATTADKTSLRNEYSYFLARNVWNRMKWTPDARFAAVFINGKFNGLYQVTEKVEHEKLSLPEGSFLATVNSRLNKEWNFRSEKGVPFSLVDNNVPEEKFLAEKQILQSIENKI